MQGERRVLRRYSTLVLRLLFLSLHLLLLLLLFLRLHLLLLLLMRLRLLFMLLSCGHCCLLRLRREKRSTVLHYLLFAGSINWNVVSSN